MKNFPKLPDFSGIKDKAVLAIIEQLVDVIKAQQEAIETLDGKNAELRRMLFGQKSERMPSIKREVKKKKSSPEEEKKRQKRAQAKRKKNRQKKKEVDTVDVNHEIEQELICPECGGTQFVDINEGEVTYEYEYVPGRFVRHRHVQQKKACKNGCCIITAPAPRRVSEGVQYGPGFHAHVAVSKCADSLPLYRQAKRLSRTGVPISRSTLCDIFHRCGSLLKPIWQEMIKKVSASYYVNADETPMPMLAPTKTRRCYIWTFIGKNIVTYFFSPSRSGETPLNVLGSTPGVLQVDAYSGYNEVCTPKSRTRAGCFAHVRRKFFESYRTTPEEARYAMNCILDLYLVEYDAADKKIIGTAKHLEMRKQKSAKIMEKFGTWLKEKQPLHPPKSPIGKAISYASANWKSLTVFLEDPKIRLDNNWSENHLRIAALNRKNFLFVGNKHAGENWAILQSLIATCQLNEVNPQKYLSDVLMRIQTHPHSHIDDLLPQNWKAHFAQPP